MRFIPHTADDIRGMLDAVGVASVPDLFNDIPAELRARAAIDLPSGLPEQDVTRVVEQIASRNAGPSMLSFLGAGAYPHFVPAAVDSILRRAENYSAYTPYQPEVSQGTLQSIFEFQTLVSMLFDLEVANASMYDGATGAAEAALMALRIRSQARRIIVARSLHPQYREVIVTYLQGVGDIELIEAPFRDDGRIDLDWVRQNADSSVAGVLVGYPNLFGIIEDLNALRTAMPESTLLITATAEPLALALVKAPGTLGADIAVGEGQSFGIGMSYGGPGVGLFATRTDFVRSMPGRLVGEAVDGAGRRGYVLTLATREQHIRRERATSNICTNHGLMALAVTVYLSLLGQQGLRRLARVNLENAHAVCRRLTAKRWKARFSGPFFNEFVIAGSGATAALERAEQAGVLAGVPLGRWYPELEDAIAVAVTEVHTTEAMDRLVEVLA